MLSSIPAFRKIQSFSLLACNKIIMTGAKAGNRPQGLERAVALYSAGGERKYLNRAERRRLERRARDLHRSRMLFVMVMLWTGARVSEALALTASSFQVESGFVSIRTLKRRRLAVREVPLPSWLIQGLDQHFGLLRRQLSAELGEARLWPFTRWTAWRLIKQVMLMAGITGQRACPRGLRHGFVVGGAQAGVPVTLLQRWLGHARLSTTAIYLQAAGPEEREIAARFWHKL
jgi:integrase